MKHQYKLLAAAVLLAGSAGAHAQIYKATLTGANEVPAVTTSGTGIGVVSLNTGTDELRVKTTFSGLTGNTTASHIHCCTAPGANAGVATQTPTFSGFPLGVTSGSYDATFNTSLATSWNAAFITANGGTPASAEAVLSNGLNAGMAYLNIHSSVAPGGEIRANLVRHTFTSAATSQTMGLAYGLDSLGAGTGGLNERLVTMAFMNNAQQSAAMAALMPMPTTIATATLTNNLYNDYDQISNRLAGLRGDSAHGLWVRYADRQNEYDLSTRSADAESDGRDIGAGLDNLLDSGLLLGIAVSMSEDEVDYSGAMLGNAGEIEGWRASVYASQDFGAGFVEGMFSIAQSDVEHERNLGGANGMAIAESDSDQWGVRLAIGTRARLELDGGASFTATPQLRLDWSNIDLSGYQESMSNGLGLRVEGQELDSFRVSLGAQMEWNMDGGLSPFVRAFWNTELESGDILTRASFVNSNMLFETSDTGPGSAGYTAGFGLNFAGSEAFAASISYDLTDHDEFESDLLTARALWRY
jgi:outer membrane autotransporter protein